MKNTRLGFFTSSGLMAAVLTALIVAGFAIVKGGMLFSPGSLNAQTGAALGGVSSHTEIAGQCSLCHAPFWSTSSMADRCVGCHTDVAAQWQDPSTLHGVLRQNNPKLACRNCHPDHRGPASTLIDLSKVNFPHTTFGFMLTAHQRKTDGSPFDCKDCHALVYSSYEKTTCSTCHAKIDSNFIKTHAQDFGSDCAACHDGVDTYGHKFNHNKVTFKLTGKHTQALCAQCHVNDRKLAELKSTPQDCAACHRAQDIHLGRLGSDCGSCHTTDGWTLAKFDHNLSVFKLDGQHVSVACGECHINHVLQGTPTDCHSCHALKDVHQGRLGTDCGSCHTTAGWTPATFDHNLSVFKLTGKHITVPCESCHINHVLQGTPTDCYSCHAAQDNHNGKLGKDCGSCHSTSGWSPSTYDHNLSTFKLTGQHATIACSNCHGNNVFWGTPTDCYSCHAAQDTHNGQFGTSCGTCHSTSAWKPSTFDHNLSSFKLTGKHVNVPCSSCHINNVFKGTSTDCYSCHASQDNHNGKFGTNCGSCHSTSGWTPATFDHSLSGFPLTGAHASLNCAQCHTNGNYGGLSPACVACHSEPAIHAGMYGTNCAQCHSTSNWNATFNHPGGCDGNCANHQQATCADCHPVNFSTYTCLKCHDNNNPGN